MGWKGVDDRAAWAFSVERPGTYTVSIEWSCADDAAGGLYGIRVGKQAIEGVVGGTGAASKPLDRTIFVNEMVLTPGKHRLEFRPAGAVEHGLLDLRAVVLTPRSENVYKVLAR